MDPATHGVMCMDRPRAMHAGHWLRVAWIALAAVVPAAHARDAAQAVHVAEGLIEGADGPVWLGVFSDERKQGRWTRVEGTDFDVDLPPDESATILAIGKDRIPHEVQVASDTTEAIAVHLLEGLTLAGSVRTEKDQPLPAEITARPAEGYGFEVPAFVVPRWRSAPTGEFEIGGLRPGRYAVEASAEGHVPLVLDDVLIRSGESNRLDIELSVAAFVSGRVVDGEGGPAVGVEVRALRNENIVAHSRDDGTFRLGPFAVGQWVDVFAQSAVMNSTRRRHVRTPYEGLLLEFPRHALLGHVVDAATGAPVQRYRLVLRGTRNSQWEHRIEAEDGTFRVPLDAEVYAVVIHADGYSPSVSDTVRCGEECRLGAIQLQQLSIAGRVVDARSGQPIAGATIEYLEWRGTVLRSYFDSLWEDVETDDDGVFELSGLPSIPVSFVVVAPGYHRKEVALPPFDSLLADVDSDEDRAIESSRLPSVFVARPGDARRKVTLAPTETDVVVELDFRDAGPTIAGQMALADGTPVAGSVRIYRTDGTAISFPVRTTPLHESVRTTDENGEFRYEGLDLPDGEYWLQPRSGAGVMDGRAVVVENGQSVENVQLLVKAGRQLRIDIAGLEPGDGSAKVTIEDKEGKSIPFEGMYRSGLHLVRGLPEEPLYVSVRTRAHMLGREVPADESELEFDFAQGRSRVAGTVTTEGRPLPDFVVGVVPLDKSRPAAKVRTTDSGHYDARGLSEGPHLVMTATGHSFEVYVAGDTPFDLDLPSLTLSGVVRDRKTGVPVSGALVRLYRAEGGSWIEALTCSAGVEGEFRFDVLAAGEYYVDVRAPGFESLARHVRLVDAEVLELELKEQSH